MKAMGCRIPAGTDAGGDEPPPRLSMRAGAAAFLPEGCGWSLRARAATAQDPAHTSGRAGSAVSKGQRSAKENAAAKGREASLVLLITLTPQPCLADLQAAALFAAASELRPSPDASSDRIFPHRASAGVTYQVASGALAQAAASMLRRAAQRVEAELGATLRARCSLNRQQFDACACAGLPLPCSHSARTTLQTWLPGVTLARPSAFCRA